MEWLCRNAGHFFVPINGRNYYLMPMRIVLLFLLVSIQLSAQNIALRKGVVMDSLPVHDTLSESYSLFLPTSFGNGNDPKPVIFVFDAEGRGKSAAQLFKTAAEEQDYIIASSNDISPENDFQENIRVAARLINEVTSKIPVDFKTISVAGFSEGARVATTLPFVFNNFHGVISVADQQMNFDFLDKNNQFLFVGIAGDEDFSSYSVQDAARELDRRGVPSQFYFFDGGHEWPNPEVVSIAVGSLTLQAMKEGKKQKNPQLINTLYNRELGRVNRLLSNGENLQAYNLLQLMENKYRGLTDISKLKDRQKQLSRSRNFKEEQRERRRIQEMESRLMEDFIFYFNEDIATANFENLGWWNYQKQQLEELTKSENEQESDMAFRLLGMLKELIKAKRIELQTSDTASLESELLVNMIQTIYEPQNFEAYKKVISLSSRDVDYSTSLFYLEEMLKHGFKDLEALYDIEGTLALKMTPEYNWVVRHYLGSSKYYDTTLKD